MSGAEPSAKGVQGACGRGTLHQGTSQHGQHKELFFPGSSKRHFVTLCSALGLPPHSGFPQSPPLSTANYHMGNEVDFKEEGSFTLAQVPENTTLVHDTRNRGITRITPSQGWTPSSDPAGCSALTCYGSCCALLWLRGQAEHFLAHVPHPRAGQHRPVGKGIRIYTRTDQHPPLRVYLVSAQC